MAFNCFSSKPSQCLQKAEGASQRPGCGAKVARHGAVAAPAQKFANPEGLGALRAVPQHRQKIQAVRALRSRWLTRRTETALQIENRVCDFLRRNRQGLGERAFRRDEIDRAVHALHACESAPTEAEH